MLSEGPQPSHEKRRGGEGVLKMESFMSFRSGYAEYRAFWVRQNHGHFGSRGAIMMSSIDRTLFLLWRYYGVWSTRVRQYGSLHRLYGGFKPRTGESARVKKTRLHNDG